METMDASDKNRTYPKSTVVLKKCMPDITDTTGTQDESKCVELNDLLDIDTDDTNTVTGEGSQMAIDEGNGGSRAEEKTSGDGDLMSNVTGHINGDKLKEDINTKECAKGYLSGFLGTVCFSEVPNLNEIMMDSPESPRYVGNREVTAEWTPEKDAFEDAENMPIDNEDLQYTDMLSGQSESDDDVSLVLTGDCEDCVPCSTVEDEPHYITTHEIQLSELSDHDVDNDIGQEWDDNQIYSFVDYAAFDGDGTMAGREKRVKSNQGQANSGAAVSTKLESDLGDRDKCAISDESLSKNQNNVIGQIHLSIKTTSRAINEPSNVQENENITYHAKHAGDMSRYVFRGAGDANTENVCDSAKCFIAAPGRLHFGKNLKGKDVNDYSSGASSAVSELDDADKEVRNLTARAFKSLAYPYFDAINFSTSSESSASELGLNRWSTFVDLKYGNMNMSQGREPNTGSHKSSTSSSEIAKNKDNKGYKGLALASTKPPPNKLFALNGALSGPYNASSAAKKLELMGKFGTGHGGVITLTETLNIRCNVKSGLPGSERRSKFAQNVTGSRSTDEVTSTLPSGQGNEASKQPCNAGETMEGTHKKAIFASSLLKNVISKKMQFEQERKMERGEIRESYHAPSHCLLQQEPEIAHMERERATPKESKDFQRQSPKYSEASSDLTIVCVDELGDLVDTSSCDAKDECRRQDTLTLAPETNLASTNEVGFDTKKGAFEVANNTLLRSQNSAFRSWRDGELEFQKEHINDKTPEGKPSSSNDNQGETDLYTDSGNSELTKMLHLFVPSIQQLSNEREVSKQLPTMNYSTRAAADQGEGGGMKLRANNTQYVAGPRSVVTSKSPEIKISLRSVKENKSDPFNVAKLVPSNIGCNSVNLKKAGDETRCQALAAALKGESSEKVPHFTVRDIRDHRGKLQTPIHQVRDVRKLVKSSYHFVSLDNNATAGDLNSDQKLFKQGSYRNPASLSPIVIKCQSVNTNTNGNGKQSGNLIGYSKPRLNEDLFEVDRSSPQQEGTKSDFHQPTWRAPLYNTKQLKGDSSEGPIGLVIETRSASRRQDKTPDIGDKTKPECKMSNVGAFEKLQAAVKTMEQLYVFDRNEWKRKSEPHSILSDSHLLSLISSEEHGPEEEGVNVANAMTVPTFNMDKLIRRDSYLNSDKSLPAMTALPVCEKTPPKREEKEPLKTFYIPISQDVPKSLAQLGGTPMGTNNVFNVSSMASGKPPTNNNNKASSQPHAVSQSPYCKGFSPVSPKLPVSVKISQQLRKAEERQRERQRETANSMKADMPFQFSRASVEQENYLTIPGKSHATSAKQTAVSAGGGCEKTAIYTFPATGAKTQMASPPGYCGTRRQEETRLSPQKRSTIVMETRAQDTPTATIYHMPMAQSMASTQPQMYCFSPTMSPQAIPQIDHYQRTQRKMLFDPSTGNYYLVDTPVQQATRRLFDPETGQYVDVPMSQQPMSPMSMSMPQMPPMPMPMPISPLALSPGSYGPTYMIYPGFIPAMPSTPTLIPTRMQSQLSMPLEQEDSGNKGSSSQPDYMDMESPYYMATGSGKSPLAGGSSMGHVQQQGRPGVQGFTSQQGPRIIAPPSFDGTTMSFVVEHR
ncbi:uncharacterized protein C4orf54 homolog [Oncorhynchus mykiss]|uniref:uncharacterized protein C4orf54 homolog n=1 Tax=Oncorhynchus mykiss TaxID=8022 RepID=UPI0018775814|nr:uncharacterized protein C4orf54 homolog [Oncorhynchus mykiss]XP_021470847.2 uncharacterized protein C4orf54 homolog [Oncorhynchus mykiss]